MMVASPWVKPLLPISPYKQSRLPAQEGIGHSSNDIPDVRSVARARIGDGSYVPPSPRESGGVLHFDGGLARPSSRSSLSAGFGIPEGVTHSAFVVSHQTTDV